MTDKRMALIELVERRADCDLLREMLAFAAERIMDVEVEARTGAAKGARSPGLDLAKTVFQVHGVSADGDVVVRRQLRRSQVLAFFEKLPRCLIGMEACASAHHWGREVTALGHEVKLMPPAYVKPYVKRGKTDSADAEAIAEAVIRATMRFVAIKSKEQQAALMLHKTRDLLIRQRTMLINALRGPSRRVRDRRGARTHRRPNRAGVGPGAPR